MEREVFEWEEVTLCHKLGLHFLRIFTTQKSLEWWAKEGGWGKGASFTVIWGVWYRAVRDCPQGLLCVLVMVNRTDFAALRGAAPVHWVLDQGGATLMLQRRSLSERCVTPPVGTWSVARKQSIRSVGRHVRNLTTSYFEWKETKFVGNKTANYSRNRSSLCLFFVKLTLLCVFSSFIRPITCPRASWEHAFRQAVAPSPSHYRDGSEKVRTFDKRTHHHKRFDRQRFVSVLWLRHAQLRDLVEVWALSGECSPPVRECSSPDWNRSVFFFVQTFVDFTLSLPGDSLWVCLRPGPWFFSQKRQIRTRSEN